jgi:hypothetical protein
MQKGKEQVPAKTKAHIRYKNKDGKIIPGVTTITGILDKPALVKWANNLGLQGIDSSKYRDEMADIGTLAHYFIMCYLTGEEPDTSDYSKEQIDKAENCLLSFFEWEKSHPIKSLIVEQPLVSEQYQYGGTIDCYARCDGGLWLIDFKTGKAIYPEMFYQLAAYRQLLIENGHKVNNTRILRIGRDESEGFEERVVADLDKQWQLFLHCLAIYNLQREIKYGG